MPLAGTKTLPPLHSTRDTVAKYATILEYAPARWGKTYLIRTLKEFDPLVLATELGDTQGLQSLADQDIAYIKCRDDQDLRAVVSYLAGNNGTYEGRRFGALVTDSLTQCGEIWTERGIEVKHWESGLMWDTLGEGGKDPRQVYAFIAERGRQFVKECMDDLPMHLCMLCREGVQEVGEGKSKTTYFAPELPGQKLPRELPGWPDATLHGVIQNGVRMFATQTIERAVAGIRNVRVPLPRYILPDLGALCRLMTGDASPEVLARLIPKAAAGSAAPSLNK